MRSSHQVIAKLACLALLLTGMGCTTILGDDFRVDSDGGDGDGDGDGDCDAAFDCEECTVCATNTVCAGAVDACLGSEACNLYVECFEQCTVTDSIDFCLQGCGSAFPDGAALFGNYAFCTGCACVGTCGTACG